MTIRTESELDKKILDVIEADRASLDRFSTTPNRQLLGALVTPGVAAGGFWSLAATKILTFAVGAAFVGGAVFFTVRPSHTPIPDRATPHEIVSTHSVSGMSQSIEPSATQPAAIAAAKHAAARPVKSGDLQTAKSESVASPVENADSQTSVDLDRWNTGTPTEVQLPTTIEVHTKRK